MVVIKIRKLEKMLKENIQGIVKNHLKQNSLKTEDRSGTWFIYNPSIFEEDTYFCKTLGEIYWNSLGEILDVKSYSSALEINSYEKTFTEVIKNLNIELEKYPFEIIIDEYF